MADGTLRGGNTQHWQQVIPIGIRQVIGRRVARLPIECSHLLSLASANGREFDVDLLSAVDHAPFFSRQPGRGLVGFAPKMCQGILGLAITANAGI